MIKGYGYELEKYIHKHFKQYRDHGEWFKPNLDLLYFMQSLSILEDFY